MQTQRLKKLQSSLGRPVLVKKKENLLYLTGRSFLNGFLLVKPINTDQGRQMNTDKHRVVFLGDGLEKIEGVKTDFLKNVGKYINSRETLELFGEFTYKEVKYIKFKNSGLKIKITVKHDPVDYQRMVKDRRELALVGKSMQIVEKVFTQVKNRLRRSAGHRPALTEIQLAEFIKVTGLKFGAQDVSFPPIVASGANAAVPHHVASAKRIKAGEPVIIDMGFKYKNYCSDFTRTVFLKRVSGKMEMAYNQVEKAYNECIDFVSLRVRPKQSYQRKNRLPRRRSAALAAPRNDKGATGNDVYQKAVDVLKEKHLEKYFIHSLGHGTGLEIHELPNLSPKSKDVLQNGMVFSIEPGVYLPKTGGVRIEDLVYLKNDKVEKFINVPTGLKNNII